MGRTITRTSSTPLIGLNHVEGKLVHHLAHQKGPNHLDHQLNQQWDTTQSLAHLLSSSDPDLCPSPCLSLTITVLMVGHSYYLLKTMGRESISTSLMAYLKYYFDIEDGFSTPNQSINMEVPTLFLTLNNMKVISIYLPRESWRDPFSTSTLQESYSYQDHLFSLESV